MSTSVQTTPTSTTPVAPKPEKALSKENISATLLTGYVPLIVATLVMILPLLWMFLSSFKQANEIFNIPIQWFPHSAYTENYTHALQKVPFDRFFVNSVIVTIFGAGIKVFLAILTAYALVFIKFPAKNLIFTLILVTLMVPPQVALLPNYALIAGLGLKNTYAGIILPGLASAFGTFLLRQQFMTLPKSLLEAAELEGAGHWKRLWQIVVPISMPTIATVTLVSIVYEWNDYLWPLIITDDPNKMTLPVGLSLLQSSESGSTDWGMLMAGSVMVILPILVIFLALQRYIVAGMTQGAVTGE
ncbi:MAG: carbohydrate ABC transporter permease [Micrococcaceae bacterium]